MANFDNISKNLSVAKAFAALTVMFGHYTHIPNFWVVVSVGMLIFSISSGYFTSIHSHGSFSWKRYWYRKVNRLVPHLLVINIFLFCLFLVQKRTGIWTFDTVVNLIGMNGVLNWLRIQNQSPFGAGMWFLTLLIIFYAVYPLLEKFYRNKNVSILFTILMVSFFYYMHLKFIYGHALWLVASGFPIGLYLAYSKLSVKKYFALLGIVIFSSLMLLCHFVLIVDIDNYFFIILISLFLIILLQKIKLSNVILSLGKWLSGILLEVYLLHPYLKISPTSNTILDILFSMIVVLAVSTALSLFSKNIFSISKAVL